MEALEKETRNRAKIEYINGTRQKDICDMLNISLNTLKSWINRGKWSQEKKAKKGAPKNKIGAPIGNINAKGNKGGSAPPGNKNAEKHGFFSKYLPQDTLDLVNEINSMDPIDILWGNIQIQYAAIVRAQRIMHVKNQEDMTKVLKRQKESSGLNSDSWEKEYELQYAWDKQNTFLSAQSRAITTLYGLIKQYVELTKDTLSTEEQKARIAVLKSKVNEDSKDALTKLDGVLSALGGVMHED